MGGSVEQWLRQSASPPTPKAEKPGDVTDWLHGAGTPDRLRTSVDLSNPHNPDAAAKVKFLQEKTGLPPDLIARDPDEVARRAVTSNFDSAQFHAQYPETAKWLAEQPEHASVALEDLSHLGSIERTLKSLKRGWQIGGEEAQIGDVHYKELEGHAFSDADKQRLTALEQDVRREPGGIGFFDNLVYKGAKMFGQLANTAPESVKGASVGAGAAGVGMGIAALAGVTVAAAPIVALGVTAGAAASFASSIFKTSSGQTYAQLKSIRGQNGEPIDDNMAQLVSLGVGAASASLMVGGAEVAAEPFKAAGQKLFAQAAKDALARPTMREALKDFGVSYAKAMGAGTGIMALQEMANITGEELAKIGSKGNFDTVLNSPASREQAIKRIGTAIKEGAEAMALAAVPGAAFHGLSTAYRARIADRNAGYFKALGESVKESSTFQRLPSGVQRLVEQQTRNGPVENVYVPAEFWNSYWQKKGEDPGDIAERVTGNRAQWKEATEHGGDVQMSTSQYATTIAPSDHNASFSKELRRSPLEMSANEAADAVKNEERATAPSKEEIEKQTEREASADRVVAEVQRQLLEAEVNPQQVTDYAAIYRAVFSTMSERTGQSPEELFKKYGLQIAKGEFKDEEGLSQENRIKRGASYKFDVKAAENLGGVVGDYFNKMLEEHDIDIDQLQKGTRAVLSRNTIPGEKPWRVTFLDEGWDTPLEPLGHIDFEDEQEAHNFARLSFKTTEFFQTPLPKGFFSQAERMIEERMPNRASVGDIRNILKDVKKEERKWIGLDDWFKQHEDTMQFDKKYAKEEILNVLRANRLKIQEKYADLYRVDEHALQEAVEQEIEQMGVGILGPRQDWRIVPAPDGSFMFALSENIEESRYHGWVEGHLLQHRFSSEALAEEHLNIVYHEIKDDLYDKILDREGQNIEEEFEQQYRENADNNSAYEQYTLPGGENYRELLFTLPSLEGEYESAHFQGEGAIFAHARLKDRADAEGQKVLFVEEIQSDWHQRGRESGYVMEGKAAVRPGSNGFWETRDPGETEFVNSDMAMGRYSEEQALETIQRGYHHAKVPDAPFRTTWHEFVFKRLLREAAEKGYDKVAWTTGEQQNERYGLEKVVDRLVYTDDGFLEGWKNNRGVSEDSRLQQIFREVVPQEKLGDYVGKEVAVKLMTKDSDGGARVLEGEDLRVGGSGMRGFYDDILPRFANKFGKKYGAKVEDTNVKLDFKDAASGGLRRYSFENAQNSDFYEHAFVHSIPLTPELKRAALANEFALFQRGGPDPLGRIRLGDQVSIDLFAKADFSTFVHESGHFFLQVLHDTDDDVSKKDLVTVRSWLGVEGEGPLTREQHEMFARGFEKYMAEGRAPVSSLQRVFMRFKTWMMAVYSSLRDFHVDLTDDVRHVFDRMFASEAAIKAEQTRQPQLFTTLGDLFDFKGKRPKMSPEAVKSYADAVERAKIAASEEMATRIMADWRREQTRVFQAERVKVREKVAEEAAQNHVIKAQAFLKDGTLPGGEPLPEGEAPFKLDTDAVRAAGRDLPGMTSKDPNNSLHPDMAADLLGFGSGGQLMRAMSGVEDHNKYVDTRTDATMRGKKAQLQMMTATEVPTEAMKAVHNEKRAELLRKELQILANQDLPKVKGLVSRLSRRIPALADIKVQAKAIVDAKTVRSLTAHNYLRAEQNAARDAIEAFNRGDVQEAFDQKQRELLNHELFRAAASAQDFAEKAADYMRRFDRKEVRQRLGLASGPYLDQIDAIRERFDFANVSGRGLDKRESLREFLERQQAAGLTPDIPDYITNEAFKKNFRELTVEQLRGVYQSARQIEHLARTKNKLLAALRARGFEETKSAIVQRIGENFTIKTEPPDYAPGLLKRTKRVFSRIDAGLTRMEFLFKYLDGHQANGPAWNALLKPIQDAENTENIKFREAQRALSDIFEKKYAKAERATFWWTKHEIPELNTALTKPSLLAIALNHGNEYNREALLVGHEKFGWTEGGIRAALNLLDKRDWDTVQAIWDHLDSYWPEIARLEKQLTGLEPERVQSTPVMTPFGEYRGGYYPIMFDKEVSWKQASIDAEDRTKDLFGGSWVYAMTKHGHTKERVGTGGKPLLLTLSPLTNHLANVIHDLSFRRAIIDVNRVMSSPEIRGAIEGSVGRDMYRELHPWLVSVAREKRGDYANAMDHLIARGRQGATIVHIGWRMTTALVHIPNYTVTLKELGPKYAAKGLADVYANPTKIRSQYRFVTDTSPFMKERFETFDRDIRDQMKRLNVSDVASGPLSVMNPYLHPAAMRASFFHMIHTAIMGGSLPTWMGGYRKALDGKVPGIEAGDLDAARDYSDSLVREVWSAGSIKDLASLQRGPEAWRAFTMFYTFMGTVYNQIKKTGQEYRLYGNFPKLVAGAALVWFVPAAMSQLLIGRGPSDTEDPVEWAKWLARTEAEWPLSTIPIVRDIARPIVQGHGDYHPSAAFDIPQTLVKVAQAAQKRVSDDTEFTRKDWQNIVDTAGYFLELPTKQLWLTLEAMFDYMTGEKQVDNIPSDVFHSLIARADATDVKKPQQRVASNALLLGELRQQFLR